MQKTENYGLNRPEAADFYDIEHFNENMDILDTKMKEIEDIANPDAIKEHIESKENPHEVTKDQVGLGNVPNVTTNNQTPTYTMPSTLTAMESGEKVSVAFGKIAKGIYDFMNVELSTPSSTATHQVARMQDVRGWLQELMDDIYASNLDKTYPVGSIYMSVNNTDPSTLFGGTWEAWGSGRVPVGVNTADTNYKTVEKTGGSATANMKHTHTIPAHAHSVSADVHTHNVPSHNHTLDDNGYAKIGFTGANTRIEMSANGNKFDATNSCGASSTWGGSTLTNVTSTGLGGRTAGITASFNTGGHNAFNTNNSSVLTSGAASKSTVSTLQPYITCYMWKRVA